MEQFNLEKYLENPNRKITTRYGDREVRIICTDRKGKRPIVALMVDMDDGSEYITSHSINGWIDDEEKYPDKRDLFFADEEEELSEFEKELVNLVSGWCDSHTETPEEYVNKHSQKLLNLARKEMMKDAMESVSCTYSNKEGTFLHIKQGIDTKDGDKVKIIIIKTE